MRQGSSVRPLNPVYRAGLVIPWPWGPQETEDDDEETTYNRRQVSELQRWLPTVFFCAALIGLLVLVLLVRAIVGTVSASPVPAESASDMAPASAFEAPAPASIPAGPQLRFTSRPIDPSYTVVTGDTLSAIAQRYNSTTAALRGINNLSDDTILSVGQRLILP